MKKTFIIIFLFIAAITLAGCSASEGWKSDELPSGFHIRHNTISGGRGNQNDFPGRLSIRRDWNDFTIRIPERTELTFRITNIRVNGEPFHQGTVTLSSARPSVLEDDIKRMDAFIQQHKN